MIKYEWEERITQNILTFLSRVTFNGADNFKEIDALQEIRHALLNPVKEDAKNK